MHKITGILIFISLFTAFQADPQSSISKKHADSSNSKYIVNIKHLTVKDGLPSNVINTGMQDRDGFLWLGTREGLVRFDGKKFKVYNREEFGLYSNNIIKICQIDDDWLWLLCGRHTFDNLLGGYINLFNTKTHKVKTQAEVFPRHPSTVFDVMKPYSDTVLLLVDRKTYYFHKISPKTRLTKINIQVNRGYNWLVNDNGIIWQVDEKHNQSIITSFTISGKVLEKYQVRPPVGEIFFLQGFDSMGQPIGSLMIDSASSTAILAKLVDGQLHQLNKKNIGIEPTFTYMRGKEKAIWFKKLNGAIYRTKDGCAPELIIDSSNEIDLSGGVWQDRAFVDQGENYWLLNDNGLLKITLQKKRFTTLLSSNDDSKSNSVRGICRDPDGNLYLVSHDVYQSKSNGQVNKIHIGSSLAITNDSANLYFGCTEGILRYDTRTSRLDIFNPSLVNGRNLWSLYHDPLDDTWWFGTSDQVVHCSNILDSCTDVTKNIFGTNPGNITIYQIFRTGNTTWLVTANGLYWYKPQSKNSGRIKATVGNNTDLLSDVHQVHRNGINWWIATNGNGLIKWDKAEDTFTQWTKSDGLSSNVLYACLEDKHGNLWISSNYGIMQFNKATGNVITYTTEDGLPQNEFNRISWYQDKDGIMYFGGLNGLVSFDPNDFTGDITEYNAPLRVTSFFQYNKETQDLENRTTELLANNKMTLKPSNSFFILNFDLLDFEDDKKSFAYKLEGLDKNWQSLAENKLQLGNLPYGNFNLTIKGQNQAGQWSSSELHIPVTVLRPFYLKWWFILFVGLSLIALVIGIIRWRTWRVNQERKRLKKQVDEQTQQIRKSLDEKEVLLKEVHHRVKNNLQIISSLLNLERSAGHDDKTTELVKEARNRIKSMALIHKNLYQHDDLSGIIMKEYLEELIKELDKSFNKGEKDITLSIDSEDKTLDVDTAIPLGLIVNELVSNSYKYAFESKLTGQLKVSLKQINNHYQLIVSDDGIGLPQELHDLNSKSLGLRLVGLLSKQLNASYSIENNSGTSFIFEIPINHNL